MAVCFAAPVVAIERDRPATGRPDGVAHLGPDLTRSDVTDADLDAAAERMATLAEPGAEIGAVLLDQRIACGVGNVYKSEVLWACGVSPFAAVADLDASTRRLLLATASKLLRANVASGGPRDDPRERPRRVRPAPDSPAAAAGRRCAGAARASRPGRPTGARPASRTPPVRSAR